MKYKKQIAIILILNLFFSMLPETTFAVTIDNDIPLDFTITERFDMNITQGETQLNIEPLKITNAGTKQLEIASIGITPNENLHLKSMDNDFLQAEKTEIAFSCNGSDLSKGDFSVNETIESGESKTYQLDGKISAKMDPINNMNIANLNVTVKMSIDNLGKFWKQSNLTTSTYYRITPGNKLFVAASTCDGLYYSSNGKNWIHSNITTGAFHDVAYAKGLFITASLSDNGLWYSEDGKTWTQSNVKSKNIIDIIYKNNIFVATGFSNNGIWYSEDGKTWYQTNITSGNFIDIIYENNIFIATGGSNNGLWYSEDGKTWYQTNITSNTFYAPAYGNGTFIAPCYTNNGIWHSKDGKTWTQTNITSGNFDCAEYGDGIFVAGEIKGIYYSES